MNTKHIIKRLKEDTAYQEFFKKAMNKFDISSPTDLKDPVRKKEFFNYVDKNYSAKSEGSLKEDYFPIHSADSSDLKKAKQALANWFTNTKKTTPGMLHPTLNILNDLIEDYALAYAQDELEAGEAVTSRKF
jgi:hypothetical protein